MSFQSLSPEVREIAERELTRKQLDALKLYLADKTIREIARALDIAPSTAWDRIQRARQLITLAMEKEAA